MTLTFYKFHGAGNDFIIADNRKGEFTKAASLNQASISALCNRRLGIGADGLMLLENAPDLDFKMLYFNSDGNPGTMCGNGGRCIVAFASMLGIIEKKAVFMASDGVHQAQIIEAEDSFWTISLKMMDTKNPVVTPNGYEINTGSPHLVIFHRNIKKLNVVEEGRKIRYSEGYIPKGINVNFVQVINHDTIHIRTYERGVEDETLACGTGTVAAAIAARVHGLKNEDNIYKIHAPGGDLKVSFSISGSSNDIIKNIVLTGPVRMVFSGTINPNQIFIPNEQS